MRWSSNLPNQGKVDTSDVPTPSTISRISSVDFVAVLPSGIFTFLVVYMVLSGGVVAEGATSLWHGLKLMASDTAGNPLVVLSVLFVSYFFGSLLRAYPVEWVVTKLYIGRRRRPRSESAPAPDRSKRLHLAFSKLLALGSPKPDVIPKAVVYDWKQSLSRRSPEAYSYFRTVEARSRFAAAMLWAGFFGILGSGFYLTVVGARAAVVQLALVSIVLVLISGIQLPKVCKHEVTTLLTLSEATRRPHQN